MEVDQVASKRFIGNASQGNGSVQDFEMFQGKSLNNNKILKKEHLEKELFE